MRLLAKHLLVLLIVSVTVLSAHSLARAELTQDSQNRRASGASVTEAEEAGTLEPEPRIWIHLTGGGKIQVDELTESPDGVWYKRGNITTFLDRTRVEKIERESDAKPAEKAESLRGSGRWKISDAGKVESFFLATFGRRLPIGAFGQSELHTRWGLDHRNGMDVPIHPDSPEGRALMKFLRSEGIPFIAFRGPVPRVSTGPHIHIGHPSPRLSR